MPASSANGKGGDGEAWARDFAALYRFLESHIHKVRRSNIPAECKARLKRAASQEVGSDGSINRRFAEKVVIVVFRLRGDMSMAINESRQDPGICQINDYRTGGGFNQWADFLDGPPLDQYRLIVEDFSGHHVHEMSGFDDCRGDVRRL